MSTTSVQRGPQATDIEDSPAGINNFVIVAATVNGSGSQTANNCPLRALFKMGIPVTRQKSLPLQYPGIADLVPDSPERGWLCRAPRHLRGAGRAESSGTAAEDIASVSPGGVVIAPTEWKLAEDRTDITYYMLPVQQMAKDSGANADLRPYVANMVYVGALTELLGIDVDEIEAAPCSEPLRRQAQADRSQFRRGQGGHRVHTRRTSPSVTHSACSGRTRRLARFWSTATRRARWARSSAASASPPGIRSLLPPAWWTR